MPRGTYAVHWTLRIQEDLTAQPFLQDGRVLEEWRYHVGLLRLREMDIIMLSRIWRDSLRQEHEQFRFLVLLNITSASYRYYCIWYFLLIIVSISINNRKGTLKNNLIITMYYLYRQYRLDNRLLNAVTYKNCLDNTS